MKILVVDDERLLVKGIKFNLENEGYQVECAYDGTAAVELARTGGFDLIILDLMMPEIDGLEACMRIREFSNVPIIMLTARSEDTDKIIGFECGADDYITKPFSLMVLRARVRALLRRSSNFSQEAPRLYSNDIKVELVKGEVYKNGKLIDLTASEYKLLCFFMENPDRILSPEQILNRLWDCDENYVDNNTLTVYIRRLRTKIEDHPGKPERIVTVRRMGYKWNTAEQDRGGT